MTTPPLIDVDDLAALLGRGDTYQQETSKTERDLKGQHFTAAADIHKLLTPLITTPTEALLSNAEGDIHALAAIHQRLFTTRFLDPAAGAGNILIGALHSAMSIQERLIDSYRAAGATRITIEAQELRVDAPHLSGPVRVPLIQPSHITGIEIDTHLVRVASDALAEVTRILVARLHHCVDGGTFISPSPATIRAENALRYDWSEAWDNYSGGFTENIIILGNPPFAGAGQRKKRGEDIDHAYTWSHEHVSKNGKTSIKPVKGAGMLDFVACWFLRAARYISGTGARAAFVATNSITQGEQPYVLWTRLGELGMGIDFAYRSFPWHNGAGEQAAVHCVIIGFSDQSVCGMQAA